MGRYRASRFLIDKIDAKLGDVDKEIDFDKNMIYGSLAVIALEIILLALTTVSEFFTIPAIVGAFLAALCIFIIPVMVQELKDDQKKAEKMKAKESETDKASAE
ncbi:MAG: hypothetical protein IKW89_04080 [Bacteroidales bacterium]|nr:hypothetical protein [Bacteroidales bacterium]